MSAVPIDDVSDTARWVAYFRALESERADALFHDTHARALAGERGRLMAERLPKGPLAWSLAIRTKVFDELILDAIRTRGVRTVLSLAAGLDARPYRLELPAELSWVEIDLPGIVSFKQQALRDEPATCKVRRFALDLTNDAARRALFEQLSGEASQVLVVTEGFLAYLDEPSVAALACDIARYFRGATWLLENVSPAVLARLKRRWDDALRKANAEMRFAPQNGLDFFVEHGFRPLLTRSLLDEAERLGREMPMVVAIRQLSRLLPPLRRAYARRQANLRSAVTYALLQHA